MTLNVRYGDGSGHASSLNSVDISKQCGTTSVVWHIESRGLDSHIADFLYNMNRIMI